METHVGPVITSIHTENRTQGKMLNEKGKKEADAACVE